MGDESIDWAKFLPAEKLPDTGPKTFERDQIWAGNNLYTSWVIWITNPDHAVVLAGGKSLTVEAGHESKFFGYGCGLHSRPVRHADGRWADGYGPDGPIAASDTIGSRMAATMKSAVPWKVGQRRRGELPGIQGWGVAEYVLTKKCGDGPAWGVSIVGGGREWQTCVSEGNGDRWCVREDMPSELIADAPEETTEKVCGKCRATVCICDVLTFGQIVVPHKRPCTGSLGNGNACPGFIAPPPYVPKRPLCEECIARDMIKGRGPYVLNGKRYVDLGLEAREIRRQMAEYHHEPQYIGRAFAAGCPEGASSRKRR